MKSKNCIICNKSKFISAFPFSTNFNKKSFYYKKCITCNFVKIFPFPNKRDLKKLYNNKSYHEKFYSNLRTNEYKLSVQYLGKFLNKKVKLLDFGCGSGSFIKEISNKHKSYGVEYDLETVKKCRKNIKNANFLDNKSINNKKFDNFFDIIHLGDVLEHVIDPNALLKKLDQKIKKKGLLYVEGPLERNISLVNISIIIFGNFKKLIRPNLKNNFKPYHLYFCNFKNQLSMIKSSNKYKIIKYEIYETGWPYNDGGLIKKFISSLSILISKLNIFGFKFGNRFRIILKKI